MQEKLLTFSHPPCSSSSSLPHPPRPLVPDRHLQNSSCQPPVRRSAPSSTRRHSKILHRKIVGGDTSQGGTQTSPPVREKQRKVVHTRAVDSPIIGVYPVYLSAPSSIRLREYPRTYVCPPCVRMDGRGAATNRRIPSPHEDEADRPYRDLSWKRIVEVLSAVNTTPEAGSVSLTIASAHRTGYMCTQIDFQ